MIASLLFVHANVRRYLLLEAARSCLEQIQVLVRGREAERANRVELFDVPQNAEYPKVFFFALKAIITLKSLTNAPILHTWFLPRRIGN